MKSNEYPPDEYLFAGGRLFIEREEIARHKQRIEPKADLARQTNVCRSWASSFRLLSTKLISSAPCSLWRGISLIIIIALVVVVTRAWPGTRAARIILDVEVEAAARSREQRACVWPAPEKIDLGRQQSK